jgi:hypothetical protein
MPALILLLDITAAINKVWHANCYLWYYDFSLFKSKKSDIFSLTKRLLENDLCWVKKEKLEIKNGIRGM